MFVGLPDDHVDVQGRRAPGGVNRKRHRTRRDPVTVGKEIQRAVRVGGADAPICSYADMTRSALRTHRSKPPAASHRRFYQQAGGRYGNRGSATQGDDRLCTCSQVFEYVATTKEDRRQSRMPMLALAHQTGVTLAEVGFLLILFAGVWLVAAEIPRFRFSAARRIVAGIALALAGALLNHRHALGSVRLARSPTREL
jgi:hypothetical protein